MFYKIEIGTKVPAYLQLYRFLRDDIVNGTYPYGTKLPSKRTLAEETGLSLITVKHAIEILCDEGYAETTERSGCFSAFKKDEFQNAVFPVMSTSDKKIGTNHSMGEFPFSVLSKTMRKVLADYSDTILVKSPAQGCDELRTQICAYLSRSRAIHVNPNQVIVGAGAEYLYGLIAQLFGSDIKFAVEAPSYDKIRKVYSSFGIKCDFLSLTKEGIDSISLQNSEAMVLHTTPFNSFPSGVSATVSKKYEYLKWAKRRSAYIIEDNYDSELTVSSKQEDALFSISEDDNVIYLNTFSKTIAPSIRVGYMILPKHLLEEYNNKLGFYSCTVPLFIQYVIAELLKSGDYERHINRVRRKRRKENETIHR